MPNAPDLDHIPGFQADGKMICSPSVMMKPKMDSTSGGDLGNQNVSTGVMIVGTDAQPSNCCQPRSPDEHRKHNQAHGPVQVAP